MITYEDVTPSLIENTCMQKVLEDGVHKVYYITPVGGYVLHDKESDFVKINFDTMEETIVPGFNRSTCSCGASYDFTANPREFYTVPADSRECKQ